MSLLHYFLSPVGRISRQAFWLGLLILIAVSLPVSALLEPGLGDEVRGKPAAAPSLLSTLWSLLMTWPSAAISIKRFNDREWPHWLGYVLGAAMAGMVLANYLGLLLDPEAMDSIEKLVFSVLLMFFLWSLIDNGFYKGTPGPNRYGPDPLAPARPGPPPADTKA